MAKTYVNAGDVIEFIAVTDVLSGALLTLGTLLCVALNNINAGSAGSVQCVGVWDLPKANGALAVGDVINFDITNGNLTSVASNEGGDLANCCVVLVAAADADSTVQVRLLPGAGVLT